MTRAAVVVVFLLFAVSLMIGCGGPITTQATGVTRSGVVFLGDSIFIRWNLVDYFPGKRYVDAGIAGQTTFQILQRVPDTTSGQNVCGGDAGVITCQTITPPQTVVIYAGWNDLFQGIDPQQAVNDIDTMVALCIQSGVNPVIATLYHSDPAFPNQAAFNPAVDQINAGILSVASKYGVSLVDLEQLFAGQSGYTVDGIHPNSNGYTQMQGAYAKVLP